jgi:hypothetical protein
MSPSIESLPTYSGRKDNLPHYSIIIEEYDLENNQNLLLEYKGFTKDCLVIGITMSITFGLLYLISNQ